MYDGNIFYLTRPIRLCYKPIMDTKNQIWAKIQDTMKLKGFDMLSLAEKAGVTRQTLYNLKNSGSCNLTTLDKIAEALGVGRAYFLS